MEGQFTLDGALNELAQWASNSKIHTEKVEMELRNMPKCTNLERDRAALRKQISKINNCMEISDDFYLNISTISTYLIKYHDPSLYPTMIGHLYTVANGNNDPKGHGNYVLPFLCSLKQQLRYIENKISCEQINVLIQTPNPPFVPKVVNNVANVSMEVTPALHIENNNRGDKNDFKAINDFINDFSEDD